MSDLMTAAIALAALNLALALLVLGVYARNARQVRSPFTLALMAFSLFLVVHNGLQVYNLATLMEMFTTARAQALLVAEGVLQAAALGMLVWATWR